MLLVLLALLPAGLAAQQEGIVPNQGFSLQSLLRGALGMAVNLLMAWAFSARRRHINWKTVGVGLGLQLLLAIGILKVPAVQ